MLGTLRHVGILVKQLEESKIHYESLGFKALEIETLRVLKMTDVNGAMIELVEGNWHPHIAVNWYDDGDGNYIETVEDKFVTKWIRMCLESSRQNIEKCHKEV